MHGFTERQASDASCSISVSDQVMTLEQARSMLPLVRHILVDLREGKTRLAQLQLEKLHLDMNKQTLTWPQRWRRYVLNEEITCEKAHVLEVSQELDQLGVTLFSSASGQVGFPTIVNNRPAFFSWQLDEETILYWHFAKNRSRRVIPSSWRRENGENTATVEERERTKGKKVPKK